MMTPVLISQQTAAATALMRAIFPSAHASAVAPAILSLRSGFECVWRKLLLLSERASGSGSAGTRSRYRRQQERSRVVSAAAKPRLRLPSAQRSKCPHVTSARPLLSPSPARSGASRALSPIRQGYFKRTSASMLQERCLYYIIVYNS